MPSRALRHWQTRSRKVLDEVEAAHAAAGGIRAAQRFARQQIAQAYVVLLCSQFQRFCRDIHDEAVDRLTSRPEHAALNTILRSNLSSGRKLDMGNASPSNLGSDFGRLGVAFWEEVRRRDRLNEARQRALDELNRWRNAIAHHDFRSPLLKGAQEVRFAEVRRWRRACAALAVDFDAVLQLYLNSILGRSPW